MFKKNIIFRLYNVATIQFSIKRVLNIKYETFIFISYNYL